MKSAERAASGTESSVPAWGRWGVAVEAAHTPLQDGMTLPPASWSADTEAHTRVPPQAYRRPLCPECAPSLETTRDSSVWLNKGPALLLQLRITFRGHSTSKLPEELVGASAATSPQFNLSLSLNLAAVPQSFPIPTPF